MKKGKAVLLAVCMFVFVAVGLLVGCGKEKKQDREMDTKIVEIFQDFDGSLDVELENYRHEDYERKGWGQEETSMEFSLDGGKSWQMWTLNTSLYENTGKGIYTVMSPDYNSDYTAITGFTFAAYDGTSYHFDVGDSVVVTIRIPESDKYAASASIHSESYVLKRNSVILGEIFCETMINGGELQDKTFLNEFPSTAYSAKDGAFVPYYDNGTVKFGIATITEENGENLIQSVKWADEQTETEKQEVSIFEYRIIKPISFDADKVYESDVWYDTSTREKDFDRQAVWTTVPAEGIILSDVTEENDIWEFTILNGTSELDGKKYEIHTTYTSIVISIRAKASADAVASASIAFEVILRQESNNVLVEEH